MRYAVLLCCVVLIAFSTGCREQVTPTAPTSEPTLNNIESMSFGKKGGMYSPTSELGQDHLVMYNNVGAVCTNCHNDLFQDAAPNLKGMKKVKMGGKKACGYCHNDDKASLLFISLMNTQMPAYERCGDCHPIVSPSDYPDDQQGHEKRLRQPH